jgi:hypothetical protein
MILGIMQPYFFPYLGYFQLINAVDTFVVYDDVNYIKQGWISRNYILVNGKKHLITLELKGASSFKLINQIKVGNNRRKLIKTMFHSYTKAPYFKEVVPVIENSLKFGDNNLAEFIINSLQEIADYLDIKTKIIMSSSIKKNNHLKGLDKGLNICNVLKASMYINSIGGKELYSKDEFKKNFIALYFIKTKNITYKQFNNAFVPNLSIIDVLMFNSKDEAKKLLNEYELI